MSDLRRKPIHRLLPVANPAAGGEISITSNTGAFWLIHSLRFTLVTDANVATRGVRITISQGATEWLRTVGRSTQAASLTQFYTGFKGFDGPNIIASTVPFSMPVDGFWLPQGHTLATDTNNIQATDQYSAIAAFITEYPTGAEFGMSPQAGYDNYRDGK